MNSIEKRMNQFAIVYMVNSTLHVNKAISFKYTVWYKKVTNKDNTGVIELVTFYENIKTNQTKAFRV